MWRESHKFKTLPVQICMLYILRKLFFQQKFNDTLYILFNENLMTLLLLKFGLYQNPVHKKALGWSQSKFIAIIDKYY